MFILLPKEYQLWCQVEPQRKNIRETPVNKGFCLISRAARFFSLSKQLYTISISEVNITYLRIFS